jgi:hypothetical protein
VIGLTFLKQIGGERANLADGTKGEYEVPHAMTVEQIKTTIEVR